MKKTILLCVLMALGHWAGAQLSISTEYRQDASWNDSTAEWKVFSSDEGATLFEFNKELTLFKHTTPTITSTYFISKWEYDEELVLYTMQVTSDAGNEYEMLVDGINNCVAFFFWYDGQYLMVRHTIKQSWYKEE